MTVASRLWRLFEPYHAVVYFAPEAKPLFVGAGWTGFWMGYFATRSAPLGPVAPGVVTATFFGFAPRVVERALPEAWRHCAPAQAWDLRLELADRALTRLLGRDGIGDPDLVAAAELAMEAALGAELAGRPIAAATAAMAVPDEAHLRLWHANTVLREHRGDGHVAALVAAGVGPLEAHVLTSWAGITPEAMLREHRGWTAEEWEASAEVAAGRQPGLRAAVEIMTDEVAAGPWLALGRSKTDRLVTVLEPIVRRLVAGGGMPYPNLVGVSQVT